MKRFFIPLILLIFLVSCDKKNYIEISREPIIIEYNSVYQLDYKIHGEVTNLQFNIEDENILYFEDNMLYGKNSGKTKLIITYNKNKKIEIEVIVLENPNCVVISRDPILIENYEEYKLKYKIRGKVESLVFRIENENIAIIENNTIFPKSIGETKLIITYNNERIEIPVKVVDRKYKFDVGNPELNQKLYDEINNKLIEYTSFINNQNKLSFDMIVSVLDKKVQQTINIMNSPLYVQINNEYIIQEENKIFEYKLEDINFYSINYLGTIDEYDNSQDYLIDTDINSDIEFDKNKVNVKYENNEYIFTAYYDELINEEYIKIISDFYTEAGMPLHYILNSIIEFKYKIENNILTFSLTINIYDYFDYQVLPINIEFIIKSGDFELLDLTNAKFAEADCFEECKNIYSFDDKFKNESDETYYYKIEAKKGILYSDDYGFEMKLYDVNHNFVSNTLITGYHNPRLKANYILPIPEDGTYYLTITGKYNEGYVNIKNIEYATVYDINGIDLDSITSFQGEIEGELDLEKFVYDNITNKTKTLIINNNGSEDIYISNLSFLFNKTQTIKSKKSGFINISPGKNELIISGFDIYTNELLDEKYEINIDIQIKEIELSGTIINDDIPSTFLNRTNVELVYYTYLDKGFYSLFDTTCRNRMELKVYNQDFELLECSIVPNDSYLRELALMFSITEPNYYYVSFNLRKRVNYTFTKYDLKQYGNINDAKKLNDSGENEGFLEGKNDFKTYVLENNTNKTKVYTINNNLNINYSLIYAEFILDSILRYELTPGKRLSFAVYPNSKFELLVTQFYDTTDEHKTLKFNFTVEELKYNNSATGEIELTEEFTKDNYLCGYGVSSSRFKINITQKSLIEFEFKPIYEEFYEKLFQLYDANNKYLFTNEVEPGIYYVVFYGDDKKLGYGKIRCILTPLEE